MKLLAILFVAVLVTVPMVQAGIEIPCDQVSADESTMASIAQELAKKAKLSHEVVVCRIPRGTTQLPLFLSALDDDGALIIIASQDMEDLMTPVGIRGCVGHEIGHQLAADHENPFWKSLPADEKLNKEAAADLVAATLVGAEAVAQAMDEYEAMYEKMASKAITGLKTEMAKRRERLAKPAPRPVP